MDFLTKTLQWLGDGSSDRALQNALPSTVPDPVNPFALATVIGIIVCVAGVWCCAAFRSEK